jgi:hypothetical protein
MGRYYSGDIEGKFWFGLQSSDAASRFGGLEFQPEYISYHFNKEEHLEEMEKEIGKIEESLGKNKGIIDDFFSKTDSYNDKMLEDANITNEMLSDYADLKLGLQIRDYIIEKGQCNFDAEL